MSPILVRPVREQLEHDRVIRLLQAKYKKEFEVAINPGHQQTMPIGSGASPWYPDLVLQSADRGRKVLGVVEVETAGSVNHLEAMSQWGTFSRFRAPFHLYVPAANIDATKRLCSDLQLSVAELWAYQTRGDQIRFTLVQRMPHAAASTARPAAARRAPAARPARRAATSKKSKATRGAARKKASRSSRTLKRK